MDRRKFTKIQKIKGNIKIEPPTHYLKTKGGILNFTMKNAQKISDSWVSTAKYSRVPHVICLADFDTNHPNQNRIDRIASEINEYVKHKSKYADIQK